MNYVVLSKQDIQGTPPRTVEGGFLITLTHSKLTEEGRIFAASFVDSAKKAAWVKLVGKAGKPATVLTKEELALDGWRSLERERRPRPVRPSTRPSISLETKKAMVVRQVDQRTENLVHAGFTVKGKTFSSSQNAQLKWMGMYAGRELLSYPVTVPTIHDDGLVSLVDASDVASFYTAMLSHVQGTLASGVLLKQRIMDADTEEDFPEDNRG